MTKQPTSGGGGYGKPPRANRFGKGSSGNPSGRPKGSKNLRTLIKQAAAKKVSVYEDGKTMRKTKMDIAVTQMFNKAVKGEPRFTQMAIEHYGNAENAPAADNSVDSFQEADAAVVAEIVARIRRGTGDSSND
jgi:hypothetical protein